MRPRYLEIEGLHSFIEKQEIDFDRLGETGLFGIFGPTGSGKSSVLDAITLALYGNVQRALRGTQGIINSSSDQVRVSFTFDLLKDGARKTYRAERVYKRKKGSESSAEAKVARLLEMTGETGIPLVDKPGEVTQKVEELLGLKLEDFTRTVVLPQNKFQEFLLLEKAKKRDMLEKIFYLEEYGRQLGERVSKRMSEVKLKLSHLEGAISSLGDCSEETLALAESMMKQAKENRDRADKKLKELESRHASMKEIWEISNDLSLLLEQEKQHLSEQEAMNRKKEMHACALKAYELAGPILKYREVLRNLNETSGLLEKLRTALKETHAAKEAAGKQYEEHKDRVSREQPLLIEKRTKLESALALQNSIAEMDSRLMHLREEYTAKKQQIVKIDEKLALLKKQAETLEEKRKQYRSEQESNKVDITYRNGVRQGMKLYDELESLKAEKEKLEVRYGGLKARIAELEKSYEMIGKESREASDQLDRLKRMKEKHEKEVPFELASLLQMKEEGHRHQATLVALEHLNPDIRMLEEKLSGLKEQLEKQKEHEKQNGLKRVEAGEKLNQQKKKQEELLLRRDENAAYMIAAKLVDGEACPVCGSLHHPAPAARPVLEEDEDLTALLKAAADKLAALEKEHREFENEEIRCAEQIAVLEGQLSAAGHELSSKQAVFEGLKEKLPLNVRGMELPLIRKELEQQDELLERRIKVLEKWESDLQEIRKKEASLIELLSGKRTEEAGISSQLMAFTDQLADVSKQRMETGKQIEEKDAQYRKFLSEAGIGDPRSEWKTLEEKDRNHEEIQKKLEQLLLEDRTTREAVDKLVEQRQLIASRFDEVRVEGEALKSRKLEIEQSIAGLTGGCKNIEAEIKATDDRINELAAVEKQLYEKARELEASYNSLFSQQKTMENQEEIYAREQELEKARLERELEQKGFGSVEEAEAHLLTKEQMEALEKEIKEYDRILRNLEAQKEMLQRKLDGRSVSGEEWQSIQNELSAAVEEKEKSVELLESEKNRFLTKKNNFDAWVKLNREFLSFRRKFDLLDQIQKLLKGNSFIEFVLEERLRYIAREASETLGVLTKYRYSLELDAENGFVICDNANGGVHRPVTSLSGGETFLTSLSLALALSKQIQLKGQSPLEFFFLDEGFGTLDSELLDTVMDSLGRLSTKDRVIGLISHVPELKNRMARRLIVEPSTKDGKGSQVRIERA